MRTFIYPFPRNICMLMLVFGACASVNAQNTRFPVREVSNILHAASLSTSVSNVLYIQNDARSIMLSDGTFPAKVKYKSNVTLVKLSINHALGYIPSQPYSYKMVYQLDGSTKINDTTTNYTVFDSVSVAYNRDSLSAFQDQQLKVYPKLYNAKLTILQFYDANSPTIPVIIPWATVQQKNLDIELAMQYQPYLKTNYLPSDMGLNTAKSFDATKSQLKVWWYYNTTPYFSTVTPAQYELEWTYADDYDVTTGSKLNSVKFDFRNNATRVTVDTLGYSIPVVYPTGYIVYRVRMVRVDSNNYQYPIYGPWSYGTESGVISSGVLPGGYSDLYKITSPHAGDSLNWNYSIQFAEGGKYKHVQSYYDGLLKNRQTITRFNSNPSQLLVTEKIYDYEGRPEITTLPSVVNTSNFGYQPGVSISSVTNVPYAPVDFDKKPQLCPDEYTIPAFTSGSLANKYYSNLNTDTAGMQKFVPKANGYPFIHTQLSPGYSDRVDIAGGAGSTLQIGHGHDVRNQYMTADQNELNRMLGINSGYNNYYTKTVSRDQNGQYSLSIKDFRGKPVLTSLIGAAVDTTNHAIMFNEEVPNDRLVREDKLDSAVQLVVGHQKSYNGSLFMDEAALTNIQYEYSFAPYIVCNYSGVPVGLTVAGDYDYTFNDDCGIQELHRSGTLGTTGMVFNPTTTPSIVHDTVTLKKGKHTIQKTLSIRTDEIYATVDSFFAFGGPMCKKTENDFIKEDVEATHFPCPDSIYDECVKLQHEMEEDLFPEGKYGRWRNKSVDSLGHPDTYSNTSTDSFSIFRTMEGWFTSPTGTSTSGGGGGGGMTGVYISSGYQAPCVFSALNGISVTIFGKTYTNLASMPRDSFIWIYQNAGIEKHKIAQALLPLHPEYCKLQNCFVDTFEKRFRSFPDAVAAQKCGYFDLDDIAAKDGQLQGKLGFVSGVSGLLKTVLGGSVRMDTLIAEFAFCMNDQSRAYGDARKYFHDKIVTLDFPDDGIRDVYFQKLRAVYLANRAKYKSMAMTNGSTDCSGCADGAFRLPLLGPPLIPVVYTPSGGIDTGAGSLFSLFADSTTDVQTRLATALNLGDSAVSPSDTAAWHDSARIYVAHIDSLTNAIAVDSITSQLANCYSNSTQMNRLRDSLRAMVLRGEVHNGVFLPDQIRYAITTSGFSLSGLCNPYLISYDYYGNGGSSGGNCRSDGYYNEVRDFLNSSDINYALTHTVSTSTSSFPFTYNSANLFASQISLALGGITNIALRANYVTSDKVLRLVFVDGSGVAGDSVVVTLHSGSTYPLNITQSIFYSPTSINIDRVGCYFEDPQAHADGYIGRFMFKVAATRIDGTGFSAVTQRVSASGWNNKITMVDDGDNSLAGCVPCTQFKSVYKDFADTMTSYGANYGDHPLFFRSLKNFSNFNLKRTFGEDQYQRFLNSCALADSMIIPAYGGFGRIRFTSGGTFKAFQAAMNNTVDSFQITALVVDSSAGVERAVIDYASVPYKLIRRFDSLLVVSGGVADSAYSNFVGTLIIPQINVGGATIDTVLRGTGFTASLQASVTVKKGSSKYPYYRYIISASSPTDAALSGGIGLIDDNMFAKMVHGYWFPNYYATYNRDYFKPEKQQYLRYEYSVQNLTMPKVLDTLQEHFIESNITALGGNTVSYIDQFNPNRRTDLYYTAPADTFSGFSVLNHVFGWTQSQLGSSHVFMATTGNTIVTTTAPSGESLNLYRCADGLYWYRYFGPAKKLYNVYVRVPSWVYRSSHPSMTIAAIHPGNGDSATRRFSLLLHMGSDTVEAFGSTDFDIAWSNKLHDVLLGNEHPNKPQDPASGEVGAEGNCEQQLLFTAILQGKQDYANYLDSFKRALRADFYAFVMSHVGEKLWVEYIDKRFAYTLYSYDLAGNLITTVPPEGVHPLDTTKTSTVNGYRSKDTVVAAALPLHDKVTHYEYNSANQPTRELTPDAGQKAMTYDAKGNVILSQSEKQRATGLFTYMLYDAQNRLTETGQVKWADCPWFADQPLYTKVSGVWVKNTPPSACACENQTDSLWVYCVPNTTFTYDNIAFAKKIRRMPRTMVVATVYDSALINLSLQIGMSAQANLRSRIGASMYFENVPADTGGAPPTANYNHATHYSYDVNGNVQTLVQEFPDLTNTRQRFKRVDYEYDLLSGKVNMLAYNRGFTDQFYQRYQYDADNRLTLVETSRDGFIWKRDAGYTYYQHGPLARVSIGDQRVQGMDYAYTIQGWLKSINGDRTDTTRDMGQDGKHSSVTPKDVYATTIDYFTSDYEPIAATPVSYLPAPVKNLYNGNIARQTTDVTPFGAITAAYTYDQMNRIRKADYAKDSSGVLQFNNWYASAYKYDLDGNIKSLMRKEGSGTTMDSLIYSYPNAAHNNKLADVLDYASYSPTPTLDLPHYTTTGATRFVYDADGNLTTDLTSSTSGIKWNIYGKTTDYTTSVGQSYHMGYDATGQRVSKRTLSTLGNYKYDNGTYYVRDAQGNILAEYNASSSFNTQSKIVTIGGVRTGIVYPYPGRVWLTALNTAGYLTHDSFSTYIVNLSGGTVTYPAGYYLAADPSLAGQFITNTEAFPLALARYSKATNLYPAASAFLKGMIPPASMMTPSLDASHVFSQLSHTLFGNPDDDTRHHALQQLAQEVPDIYSQILSTYSITLNSSSDSIYAAGIMDNIATGPGGPDYYATRLGLLYGADPSLITSWLQKATSDSTYLMADWAEADGYLPMLRSALTVNGDDAANDEAMANSVAKHESGYYGAASWWPSGMGIVTALSGGGLSTLAYSSDPINYLNSILPIYGAEILDTALSRIPDGDLDLATLAGTVSVSLTDVQYASLSGVPYLENQSVSLGNHHIYGSSRLGIAQYQPSQYRYQWDYKYGLVDTFGLTKQRSWYSYLENAPMNAGTITPYGNQLDSVAEADHIIGQKQYELVNHLANVQETVSDKKYSKDLNGDSTRDEYRAASVMVYDYYPFGMLMPGRSLDTAGLCVTRTTYQEVPHYNWFNGGALDGSGGGAGASAVGSGTISSGSGTGVNVSGSTSGGISFTISGITAWAIQLKTFFNHITGTATITIWQGTNTSTSGTQLGSTTTGVVSPAAAVSVSAGGTATSPATVTVVVSMPPSSSWGFNLDSIGYQTLTYTLATGTYTQCGNPVDKYEFGFNGKYKDNEIAGVGNSQDYGFRMYDPRVARFKSVDPITHKYPELTPYQFASNTPIRAIDLDGLEAWLLGTGNLISPQIGLMGESDIMIRPTMSPLEEMVEAGAKAAETGNESQEHHIAPKQIKDNDVIDAARKEGFKYDGAENKMPVEKFSKATGEGQHGNHPNYTREFLNRLNDFKRNNPNWSSEDALKFVRNLVKEFKETIENNPKTKLNDLFNRVVVPPSSYRNNKDNVRHYQNTKIPHKAPKARHYSRLSVYWT